VSDEVLHIDSSAAIRIRLMEQGEGLDGRTFEPTHVALNASEVVEDVVVARI
jgi:hypothetical protein